MGQTAQKSVKRVQAMFTERQYELLTEYARETGTPVSALVRKTVEESLLADLERRRRQQAVEWMAAQNLPVDDWEVVERQIESRWEACGDE